MENPWRWTFSCTRRLFRRSRCQNTCGGIEKLCGIWETIRHQWARWTRKWSQYHTQKNPSFTFRPERKRERLRLGLMDYGKRKGDKTTRWLPFLLRSKKFITRTYRSRGLFLLKVAAIIIFPWMSWVKNGAWCNHALSRYFPAFPWPFASGES